MITLFNRREVVITCDMQTQARARDILAANNIDYIVKVRNMGYRDMSRTYEYKIYVHKNDWDHAMHILR